MTQRAGIERAIIQALQELGPATARQVEAHEAVVQACRFSKLKCRHQLALMTIKGLIKSDGAAQAAVYGLLRPLEVDSEKIAMTLSKNVQIKKGQNMAARKGEQSSTAQAKVKPKADWQAIERDYRTGKFTLRELAAKHGSDPSLISRRAKKLTWIQDLSEAIKQATNIKLAAAPQPTDFQLVDDLSTENVHKTQKSQQDVHNTIASAAEVNVRVILGHRTRLASLAGAVEAAREQVLKFGGTAANIRDAATFSQAVGNLASAEKTLIDQERKAHNLDDAPAQDSEKQSIQVEYLGVKNG